MRHIERLLELFLEELNKVATSKIGVVVLGGNVLVSLNLRKETHDVDIVVQEKHKRVIDEIIKKMRKERNVGTTVFFDGNLIDVSLPDFWERAMPILTPFENVELRFFNLNDLILLKIDRGMGDDFKDAENIITSVKELDTKDLVERFKFMLQAYHGPKGGKDMFKLNVQSFFEHHGIPYPLDADEL